MTWRSLYACRNGWRRLRPGCIHALKLPSVASTAEYLNGYPTYCVLDGRDLGWTVAAGDASELLVVNAWEPCRWCCLWPSCICFLDRLAPG